MVYPVAKRVVRPIIWLLLKEAKGLENIPKNGPFIVASNHSSFLDPLLLAYFIIKSTNQKVHFIAYGGRFSFLGDLIIKKWAGCILIRYNKKEIENALEEAVSILKKGGIVGIFPAAPDHDLARPKTGVARIAIKAKCPVLPVAIKGTESIMPAPSLFPRSIRRASLQFQSLIAFKKAQNKKTQKNINAFAHKVAKAISSGLNQK